MVRRGVRVAAREAMQKHGYDPLEKLVLVAQDDATPPEAKLRIAETLLPYMYPKLSNVTIEGELTANVSVEAQAQLLKRMLEDPQLADAAQRLSIAAAEASLEVEAIEGEVLR